MKREKSENLFVIIGNGFDLAHGLKTSFTDFAKYYLKNEIIKGIGFTNSNIFSKSFLNYFADPLKNQNKLSYSKEQKDDLLKLYSFIVNGQRERIPEILTTSNDWIYSFLLKNKLFGNLFNKMKPNWFDVEQTYFEGLKQIFNTKKTSKLIKQDLINLNNELYEIEEAFHYYLHTKIKPEVNEDVYSSLKIHFKDRKQVCFINFNYTYTVNLYITKFIEDKIISEKDRYNNICIHGDLMHGLIIGYGDDTDDLYKKMKDSLEIEYLRNFKTFQYLYNSDYREMLNELAVCLDYDVLVIGHSLAATDKTILKTIMDNSKCNNIELLKRSDITDFDKIRESQFELHANLSRIFSSEIDLREKIIPIMNSINFPIMKEGDLSTISYREEKLFDIKKPLNLGAPSTS